MKERQTLENSYKELCKEKKIKEKNISSVSDESLNLLIEQIKEIEMPKVEEKVETKSVVIKQVSEAANDFIIESSDNGQAMWAMPDSKGRIQLRQWQ